MNVSVAIAAFNEGPDLEATLSLLLAGKQAPDEIIVVDDSSQEPIEDRVRRVSSSIRVITNETQQGAGPSKHAAVEACTGDLVVVMDAHLRPPWDWIELFRRDIDRLGDCVYCPASLGFESESGFFGVGGDITDAPDGHQAHFKAVWKVHQTKPGRDPIQVEAPIGGCYAFTRPALEKIGGYCPLLIGYGYEEEWIGLRAFMLGVPVWACPAVRMPHRYHRKNSRTPRKAGSKTPAPMEFNSHATSAAMFDRATYSKLTARKPPSPECRTFLLQRSEQIGGFRQFLQSRRVASDADFALLGITLE